MCTVGTQYDAVCLQEIVSAVSNSVFSVAQMMQAVSVKCAEVQSSHAGVSNSAPGGSLSRRV